MMRENNFNFLRAFFATLVIVSHGPEIIDGNRSREPFTMLFHTLSAGEFAVNAFFMLSGYLILQSWRSRPDVVVFMEKRILRIYPGFILASVLCIVLFGYLGGGAHYFSELDLPRLAGDMLTLHMPELPPVFQGSHYPFVDDSMWTIQYEFACYLFVAVVGQLSGKQMAKVWWGVAVLVFLAYLANRMGIANITTNRFGFFLLRFLVLFSAGGCFALAGGATWWRTRPVVAVAMLLLLTGLFSHRLVDLVYATAGGVVLFAVALDRTPWLLWYNRLPDLSYGIYLYAWPMEKLLVQWWPQQSVFLVVPEVFLFSIAAGWLSWHVIERRALSWKPVTRVSKIG